MKKDIVRPEVTEVSVAVVQEENELGELVWNAYLVNQKTTALSGVLVSSRGYGQVKGEQRSTSTLRHFLDTVPPRSAKRIEVVIEEVFSLFNEYWVSFVHEGQMYDKKYIFPAESIQVANLTSVPCTDLQGVLIH